MRRHRVVRVPASSANLGPGFDVLAAALDLHVEVEIEETGRFAVWTDLPIARDRRNLCVRAFDTLADAGRHEFAIRSDIPLSGGLGTSAAAIVAGLVAAQELTGGTQDLLAAATKLEGHPDNVAAALLPSPRPIGMSLLTRSSIPSRGRLHPLNGSWAARTSRFRRLSGTSPAPSPVQSIVVLADSCASTVRCRSSARARTSKPGPRLADDAGTRTAAVLGTAIA